jgi:hypothetical protein
MNMMIPKKRQIALLAALAVSICGISATAFSGFASTGSINTAADPVATDNAYLESCNSCNATEADYENLTTFELLAIYPELSGDPLDNATGVSRNAETGASTGTETNNTTSVMPAPIGNTTTSNQTSMSNSTGNSTSVP